MPERLTGNQPPEIADHELLRHIGSGAYGEVWLARSVTGSYRAVKIVFRRNFSDTRPYDREFAGIRKFEPLSRSSEALVDVLQIGRNDEAGYFYYVMELADDANSVPIDSVLHQDGDAEKLVIQARQPQIEPETYSPKTLSSELQRRSRIPYEECLQLGLSLNLALVQLHRNGLIHRDIKPANIIFVNSVPKLADIGLVTDVAEAESFVGTEGYIPPEGPNTPRADLYSLGKVLYEASMGKDRKNFPEPFTNVEGAAESEALMELNAVVVKACALNPADGYQSAEEMYLDLALLQSGRSVKRKRTLEKRLAFVSKVGGATLVFAVIALAGYFYQQRQTRIAEAHASTELQLRKLAEDQRRRAETSERESRSRLVRMHVNTGLRYMEEGDHFNALLWFLEALKADQDEKAHEAFHRIRIGAVLNQLPKLAQVWTDQSGTPDVQFSPDSRHIALVTEKGHALRILDAASGEPVTPAIPHAGTIRSIVFSSDGAFVLTTDSDRIARLWNIGTTSGGKASIEPLKAAVPAFSYKHSSKIICATFSPDSKKIVTGCEDGEARVWKIANGELIANFQHPNHVISTEYGSDGRYLLTVSDDGMARIWSTDNPLEPKYSFKSADGHNIHFVTFSPDGQRVLAVADDQAEIWSVGPTEVAIKQTFGRGWWIVGACFSPDGKRVVTWARDATAKIWDVETGTIVTTLQKHQHVVLQAEFSGDGNRILTTSEDGTTRIWDVETGESLGPPLTQETTTLETQKRFSRDGSSVLASSQGVARLYRLTSSDLAGPTLLNISARRVTFTKDSRFLITVEQNGFFRLWDPATGQLVRDRDVKLALEVPQPTDMNLTPLNPKLVPVPLGTDMIVTSQNGSLEAHVVKNVVTIRDAKSQKMLGQPLTHKEAVTGVAFSDDGAEVATSSFDSTVKVWAVGTGDPLTPALRHPAAVDHVAFSPDGKRVATISSAEKSVRVWKVEPDSRPLEDLLSLAHLITAREIGQEGSSSKSSFTPQAAADLWQSLKRKYPDQFQVSPTEDANWNLTMALYAIRRGGGDAAVAQMDPKVHKAALTLTGDFLTSYFGDQAAKEAYAKAVEENPQDTRLRCAQGVCFMDLGETTNAMASFSSAIKLEPECSSAWAMRSRCFASLKQWPEAFKDIQKAIEIQPFSPGYWFVKGSLHRDLLQWKPALESFRRGHELINGTASEYGTNGTPLISLLAPRDPKASSDMIDLGPFYNTTLTPLSAQSKWPSVNFSSLKAGVSRLANVDFDVRGAIQLSSFEIHGRAASFPIKVLGIPVQKKARRIHFLQSANFTDTPGNLIGKYVFYFADGSKDEQLIFYDEHVRDRRERCAGSLRSSIVASSVDQDDDAQTVYLTTWENARPDIEIVAMDFVSVWNYAAPVLLAVTAEP